MTPTCRQRWTRTPFHAAGCAHCATALEIAALAPAAVRRAAGPPLHEIAREQLLRRIAPSLDELASTFAATATRAPGRRRVTIAIVAAALAIAMIAAAAWRALGDDDDDDASGRRARATTAPAAPPPPTVVVVPLPMPPPPAPAPPAIPVHRHRVARRPAPPTTAPSTPSAVRTAEERYQEAEAALRAARPDDAEAAWRDLVATYPDHPLADLALYDLARLAVRRGHRRAALDYAERVLARGRDPSLREPAAWLRCELLAELDPPAYAPCARAFAAEFPASPHAAAARETAP